jgi:hypothetical protein
MKLLASTMAYLQIGTDGYIIRPLVEAIYSSQPNMNQQHFVIEINAI